MLKFINKKFIKNTAVVLLLVFLYAVGILNPIENFFLKTLNPVLKNFYFLGFKFNTDPLEKEDRNFLIEENKRLTKENIDNIIDKTQIELLKEENEILRDSLGFLSRKNYKFVEANVISRGEIGDLKPQVESIIIDKGASSNFQEGLAVVDKNGSIVGKIFKVKENSSLVYLSNNEKCKFAATILNEERTSGITEGELGLTVKMSYIPQDRVIKEGDIVVTSGLEENIKRGLVIGKISQIIQENNELWQEAKIKPLIELDNLIFVSVILP